MTSTPPDVQAPRMRVHTLSFAAWALAGSASITFVEQRFGRSLEVVRVAEVERLVADLTEDQEADLWAELVSVGMATAAGEMVPAWAAAIVESAAPDVAVRAASTFGRVNGIVDLTLVGQRAMAVMRRRHVSEDAIGDLWVDGVDEIVEVTLCAAENAWPALRRCLPPDEALRAPAHVTSQDDRVVHLLSAADREALAAALEGTSVDTHIGTVLERLPGLDEALRDAVADPVATVALAVMTGPRVRPPWVGLRLFALGRSGLYSINTSAGSPRAIEVEPGAVAADLAWLLAGAYDAGAERTPQEAQR